MDPKSLGSDDDRKPNVARMLADDVAEALKAKVGDAYLGQGENKWLPEIRLFATEAMMDLIRQDLAKLGIEMDHFFSEKSLYGTGKIESALASLTLATSTVTSTVLLHAPPMVFPLIKACSSAGLGSTLNSI